MRKTLLALAASSALIVSGMTTKAEAHSWWVVPAIVGGALVTGAVIANSAYAYGPYYGPGYYGTVSVRPSCRLVRERTAHGWRRVRVCG